ncbi:MAG: protein disulfide oxidoreductase [Moraxella sp.]|nr:protein disulfide oxidoreductase [Moraxella sp.]
MSNRLKSLNVSPKLKSFTKSVFGYAAVFVVIYTLMGYIRQPVMPDSSVMAMLDGRQAELDTLTLVYFWGSWCHVCTHTSPIVNEIAKENPVLTVAVSSGDDQAVGEFVEKKGYHFEVINDETGEIFGAWQGQVTPSYVIIKDNKMVQGFVGVQPKWLIKIRLWLAKWQ